MFLITNRHVEKSTGDPSILGKAPNREANGGPNELRAVEARRVGGKWKLVVLPDRTNPKQRKEVAAARARIGTIVSSDHVVDYVAFRLLDVVSPQLIHPSSTRKGKNLLVFCHGFNNDVEDVLDRCHTLSRLYGIEVLAFTWPANGGGALSGTMSYKADKRDARLSIGAFDRLLGIMHTCVNAIREGQLAKAREDATRKHPDNLEDRDALVARIAERECPFTINLMLHSMGNYLYKHLLLSTASEGNRLLFDNVVLAAADTNNEAHAAWVDRILCRKRVYITINEDDRALQVSRLKAGEEQLARLGHYPFNLYSRHAAYVQFTGATKVGNSHAYFADRSTENAKVKRFFKLALNGERAHERLPFDAASNTYEV
ncbi:MAG: alpha/beta hydrolase [Planctomycetota bacterium]